ncbi:unnamed protein product [Clavelina lepadiformis]|uniref:non-specific serine/threonine protein kinase n=1 Tax=Clavelina lepadiformis TaxID=159417 RepID=A0ABP0FTW7_CLALP
MDAYEVLKPIGKGSYGEVHLIQHKKERKQYVVKKMILHKASKRERKAAQLEAKLLSKLKHPNIVSYKDSFEHDDGSLYIVMGYAEGGDLYTRLREQRDRNEFLSEVQVVRWFIQICMALQYLHQQHILHRDLKTQNIFLTKTKMVKVGDLGIARVLEGATDMATTLIGTPYYMSPELFSNKPYSYKSDVWSLGCCVYEMTTLKHAFNAKDMNSLVYKILKKRPPKMPDQYSEELCEIIKSMLHQNADKRPSVNKVLRHPFIKKHIQLFLDESSKSRRPTSGRSQRGSEMSSRKTSTSSAQSRCSSRESNHSVLDRESPKPVEHIFAGPQKNSKLPAVEKARRHRPHSAPKPKTKDIADNPPKSVDILVSEPTEQKAKEKKVDVNEKMQKLSLENSNNNNKLTPPSKDGKYSQGVKEHVPDEPKARAIKSDYQRAKSAGSTASSSSEDSKATVSSRPLPSVANRATSPTSSVEMRDSRPNSSEQASISSSRVRVSSARERRRKEKQRQAQKEDETKKKHIPHEVVVDAPVTVNKEHEQNSASDRNKRKESSGAEEINQFYTLLHTTLKLNSEEDSPPLTPPQDELIELSSIPTPEEQRINRLTPVQELSESSGSSITQEKMNVVKKSVEEPQLSKNTPPATVFGVQMPMRAPPMRGISQATLGSTGRLMDRIVALRKDCIRGLGVPLLHRAYELLDGNYEEEQLEKSLVELLGEVRFKQWAGKIWQLKFCEESIFKHCGSITAY